MGRLLCVGVDEGLTYNKIMLPFEHNRRPAQKEDDGQTRIGFGILFSLRGIRAWVQGRDGKSIL